MMSNHESKTFACFLIPFLLASGGLWAGQKTRYESAMDGEWKFNLMKSSLANMPVPQQATLIISIRGNRLTWSERSVGEHGACFNYKFNGFIDGKPYPVQGASRVTIRFQRKNGAIVGRWKGKGERISIAKVSEDGNLLTVENISTVYNMVGNWTTAWDKVPHAHTVAAGTGSAAREQK